MTAALYALSAALVAALATRAWLLRPDDHGRRAVLGLGWTLFAAYLGFAVSLLPGANAARAVWTAASLVAAAYLGRAVDATFPRPEARPAPLARLVPVAAFVGPALAAAHALGWGAIPRSSPAEIVSGALTVLAIAAATARLLRARADAPTPAIRTRIELLAIAIAAGVVLGVAEWAVRTSQTPVDDARLAFFDRGVELQGALPPMSTLLGAWTVYVLVHAQLAERVPALQERVASMLVVVLGGASLVALHAASQATVALTRFPLHASYLLLLVSCVFLTVWDAWRPLLQRRMLREIHHASRDLDDAVDALRTELPRQVTQDGLLRTLVDGLHGSGRFGTVAVWLAQPALDSYRLALGRSADGALRVVPATFAEGFEAGLAWYDRRELGITGAHPTLRSTLDELRVDVALPLRHGGAVLGWLGLRDAPWSDGLAPRELRAVTRVVASAAIGLGNIADFQRLAEARRLQALGAMSAGLAHEIRNPLAGLKGAVQVLQGDPHGPDAADMLDIVVTETDRLDRVVRDFLDVARPLVLHRDTDDLADVLDHAAGLVRAAGLPPGVEVEVDLPDPAPRVPVDGARLGQVLLNLLRNAIDALEGLPTGRVRVAAARREGVVEVTVSDDGPGIPARMRDALFTPFVTTKHHGTGLGLALSRRIVEAHDGTLDALPTPAGDATRPGATFVIRLPVGADQPSSTSDAATPAAGSGPAPVTSRVAS